MLILQEIKSLKTRNKWLEITQKFGKLKETNPQDWQNPLVVKEIGFAFSQMNQHSKAKEFYNHWVGLESEQAVSHYSLGYVFHDEFFVKRKDKSLLETALLHYEKALELYPTYLVVIFRKGNCLESLEKFKEAAECFKTVFKIYEASQLEDYRKRNFRNYQKSIFNLGKCLKGLKKFDKALKCFEKCLSFPNFPVESVFVYYNVGICKMKMGNFEEAIVVLNLAHLENSSKEFVLAKIGSCYYLKKDFQKAVEFYSKAIKIRNQGYIVFEKGLALWKSGEVEDGINFLKMALGRSANAMLKHKIFLALAKIEIEKQNFQKAEIYCKKSIKAKIDEFGFDFAEAHLELAKIYGMLNRNEDAIRENQIAIELKPDLTFSVNVNTALEVNYL